MTQNPRPWRINPDFDADSAAVSADPPAILDAQGGTVLGCSEWLEISKENLELIVQAVNEKTIRDHLTIRDNLT